MRHISSYMDANGFIGHKTNSRISGLEFGDGWQRTGTFWSIKYHENPDCSQRTRLFADQLNATLVYEDGKPQWVRHWDKTEWEGMSWIMSRDNFKRMFWSAALFAPKDKYINWHLNLMLKQLFKRGGLLWNYKDIGNATKDFDNILPDWFPPWELLSMLIRAKRLWILYPLVLIFDVTTIIRAILRVLSSYYDPYHTSDDLNFSFDLIDKQTLMWTPTNFIARMVYNLRGRSGPRGKEKLKGRGILTAWFSYYDEMKDPPMAELAEKILKSRVLLFAS